MNLASLRQVGRSLFNPSAHLVGLHFDDSAVDRAADIHSLARRLDTAQALSRPGFMTLHAVRQGAEIVDFEWDNASVAAIRWLLGGGPGGLLGKRLVEVLAGHAGRGEVFSQYWRVVEFGAAKAVLQNVEVGASVEVLRHAAVRVHDGVAVTLTNLSAVRRELALRREIASRIAMGSAHAG